MVYEMAAVFGKAAFMAVGAGVALLFPGNFTVFFLMAAAASLLYARIP